MESTKVNTETAKLERPELHHLFTPENILKTEKLVNKRMCQKTLDLAEKYLKRGDTISSFNTNFMNEMIRADPEKFKSQIIQETGMCIGMDTMTMYARALKYFTQSNEAGFKDSLGEISNLAKKIMDKVFRGGCSLPDVEDARQLLSLLE